MKRKISGKMGSIFLSALLAVTGISGAFAFPAFAEEETAEEETFEISVNENGGTATLINDTDTAIEEPAYTPGSDENASGTLTVTEEDGTVHNFDDIKLDEGSEFTILEKIGFFYVTDPKDEDTWYYEDASEKTLDVPVTMYALTSVNIREGMDTSSESLGQAETGSEVEVTGGAPEWLKVTQGDVSGYIAARYLTADEEDLAEAQDEDAARAEAEEVALAAAEEAAVSTDTDTSVYDDVDDYASDAGGYYYDDVDDYASDAGGYYYDDADDYASDAGGYSDSASDTGDYTYEAVYDCDGSGNGYYEITDSSGNVVGYEDF